MKKLIKSSSCIMLTLITLNSCVTKKKYEELSERYRNLALKNQNVTSDKNRLSSELEKLNQLKADLTNQTNELDEKLAELNKTFQQLEKDFEQKKLDLNAKNSKNKELNSKLTQAQKELQAKQDSLQKVASDLDKKISRINELESLLNQQKEKTVQLKKVVSKALKGFEGKGLTVEQRNGKIYVSMENKLLFPSGKWTVQPEGKRALVKLGTVLAQQSDLNIMIEGHTDSDAFRGKSSINDNWDLSVRRATAITKLIQKQGVDPKYLTAAGKGEFSPIGDNETTNGKAKNRRVEVVLTPKLDDLNKLLNEI